MPISSTPPKDSATVSSQTPSQDGDAPTPEHGNLQAEDLPQELCKIQFIAGISIVVPTYREVENIPPLLERIDQVRRTHNLTLEVLFMDDDSNDGSVAAVEAAGYDWARIIVRTMVTMISSPRAIAMAKPVRKASP